MPCHEPHPYEVEALDALRKHGHLDGSLLVQYLPCVRTMRAGAYRRQYNDCIRSAREVLEHLRCRGIVTIDRVGWYVPAVDLDKPLPTLKPKRMPRPPRPVPVIQGGGLRLVHSRRIPKKKLH